MFSSKSRSRASFPLSDFDDDLDVRMFDETIDDIPSPTGCLAQAPIGAMGSPEPPREDGESDEAKSRETVALQTPLPYDFLRIHRNEQQASVPQGSGRGGAGVAHVQGAPASIVVDVRSAHLPSRVLSGLYVKLAIVGGRGWSNRSITEVNDKSAKNPVWNQRMTLEIPEHVQKVILNVEIISLNWLSEDNSIGCASIDATNIADGNAVSSKYELEEPQDPSFKGKVKTIGEMSLVMRYQPLVQNTVPPQQSSSAAAPAQAQVLYTADGRPMVVDGMGRVQNLYTHPVQPQPQGVSKEQTAEIKAMFPSFGPDVVDAVIHGSASPEAAIERLLAMA